MVAAYFALRGTTLDVQYQEREAWRGRLISAATDFHAKHLETAVLIARWVDAGPEHRNERRKEAEEAEEESLKSLAALPLLFGVQTPASDAVERMRQATNDVTTAMRSLPPGADDYDALRQIKGDLIRMGEHRVDFIRAVHAEIDPTSVE